MDVKLLSYQEDALEMLLYVKNTRLRGVYSYEDICSWPAEKKEEHLGYVLDSIPGCWEFVDYTFEMSGVTRAFTHQLVRTRTASFAQESHRAVDATEAGYLNTIKDEKIAAMYDEYATQSMDGYKALLDVGASPQDARGLLPTNVLTGIIMKANLRTLSGMAETRLCTKTQGEYQEVFRLLRSRVIEVHPWAEPFLEVHCVSKGVCAFPRFDGCHIQQHIMTPQMAGEYKERAKKIWNNHRRQADPRATGEGLASYKR